nr:hypothetical protein [Tanacetum cinerariifolium]
MTRNLKLLANFVEKFLGMNHNLFSVGQFYDADLDVAFWKSTCYIRDLKRNDLLIATSSQAWLWHRYLSHLNFNTINLLSKNDIEIGLPKLKFVKDHLCSSCELGKAKPKSKDETPEVLIDFLRLVQRGLHAQVRIVQTDKGMEFLNKTLHAYFAAEWINHQMSVARTPKQNGVVKRWNRTLVEATRTILSATKVPLDSTQSRAYRVFNKRTRVIVETIHVNFDELPQMASDHVSSDLAPQCPMTALEHDSLSPGLQCQENVPQAVGTISTSNELDLLLSLMFDELLNGSTQVVSKSSAVTSADAYHPLEQVIGNHSQSIRIRHQLESNGEMCMFTLTVSRTEPKNIKEAMADSAWIKLMQEELHL